MKQNSICPTIQELERVYDLIAKKNGLDKIAKRPLITIQTRGRNSLTTGWRWDKKWKEGNTEITEINICAEALKENSIETLIHEISHYHNNVSGIKDCNRQGYHKKAFKNRAGSYGLNCIKSGRNGWSFTSLSEELQNLTLKASTKMKKWTCACTTVRCATELNAVCKNCNKEFVKDE